MIGAVPHPLLFAVLRCLPAPLKRALDAWSSRVARRRAELRRDAALRRQALRKA